MVFSQRGMTWFRRVIEMLVTVVIGSRIGGEALGLGRYYRLLYDRQ